MIEGLNSLLELNPYIATGDPHYPASKEIKIHKDFWCVCSIHSSVESADAVSPALESRLTVIRAPREQIIVKFQKNLLNEDILAYFISNLQKESNAQDLEEGKMFVYEFLEKYQKKFPIECKEITARELKFWMDYNRNFIEQSHEQVNNRGCNYFSRSILN